MFAGLAAIEVGLRVAEGWVAHVGVDRYALIHEYPSGHTARIPLLGGMLIAALPVRWKLPAAVATGALALLEAMDRVDSTLQTGSDVVGGMLLGTTLACLLNGLWWRLDRVGASATTVAGLSTRC